MLCLLLRSWTQQRICRWRMTCHLCYLLCLNFVSTFSSETGQDQSNILIDYDIFANVKLRTNPIRSGTTGRKLRRGMRGRFCQRLMTIMSGMHRILAPKYVPRQREICENKKLGCYSILLYRKTVTIFAEFDSRIKICCAKDGFLIRQS